ncbi:protein kinase domain-containing protein [Candidatus Uabimicrobium amorphum]|nr:serine/threonine-protein kinase [Candidatus Uabimicrobium amorphum]
MTQPNNTKMFGQYTIYKQIGAGGMGAVYQAFDNKLQRPVAIKIITGQGVSQSEVKRFLREARAMAQLDHENIIKIYDTGLAPTPFIAMEYIEGSDLSTLIKMSQINTQQLIKVIIDTAKALSVTHKAGIIHRDIKPSNIMITKNHVAKLMDFGLAKVEEDQQLSKSGSVIGTPAYMPPEQVQGIVKPTNDIYSLGAVLYEGLTGRPPFEGETSINILAQIMMEDPIPPRDLNPDISPYLEAISLKCLHKKPAKRYTSATEFARDLQNFVQNRPIQAKPYTRVDRFRKLVSRNKLASGLVGALFISLVSIIVILCLAFLELQRKNREILRRDKVIDQEEGYKGDIYGQILSYAMELVDVKKIVQDQSLADKFSLYMNNLRKIGPKNLFTADPQIANEYFTAFLFPGSPKQKLQKYSAIIEKNPFIVVLSARIEIYIDLKMYDEAKKDCRTIIGLNSTISMGYWLLAKVLYHDKKYQQGLEEIEKVFVKKVEAHQPYLWRGLIHVQLKNYEKAIEDLSVVMEKRKGHMAYMYRGNAYLGLKDYPKAIEDYKIALELAPNVARLNSFLALAYQNLGNNDKAIMYYEKYADILFKKKRYTLAIGNWRKAVKLTEKKSPERKRLRAKVHKAQKLKK